MRGKRNLPANVDGRLKVGPFPIKNFLIWLPIALLFVIFFFLSPGNTRFIIAIFGIAISSIPFMEFQHRTTGLSFFKELFYYDVRSLLADFFPNMFKHKQVYYERTIIDDSNIEKYTLNEKVYNLNKQSRKEEVNQHFSN